MEKCIWKQSQKSPSIGSFSFFPFLGREGTFTENQCGVVDGTPHRLWSSVLAGRDNYTAVCNKVSKQTNIFYTTFSTEISARVSWERSTPDHFSVVWRFNLLFYLKSTQNKKQSHWTLRNSSDLQRYQKCISLACIPSYAAPEPQTKGIFQRIASNDLQSLVNYSWRPFKGMTSKLV